MSSSTKSRGSTGLMILVGGLVTLGAIVWVTNSPSNPPLDTEKAHVYDALTGARSCLTSGLPHGT